MERAPQQQPQPDKPNYTPAQLEKLQGKFNDHGKIQRTLMLDLLNYLPSTSTEAGSSERKNAAGIWMGNNVSDATDSIASHFNSMLEENESRDEKDKRVFDISTPEKTRELLKEVISYKGPETLH